MSLSAFHTQMLIFLPILLDKKNPIALSDWMETAIYTSCHRFSFRLRPGFWQDHSHAFSFLVSDHSSVGLVCLVCCLAGHRISLATCNKFSSRTALHMAPSIFPSTLTRFSVLASEKNPQDLMLPLPCFTVAMLMSSVAFPPNVALCTTIQQSLGRACPVKSFWAAALSISVKVAYGLLLTSLK